MLTIDCPPSYPKIFFFRENAFLHQWKFARLSIRREKKKTWKNGIRNSEKSAFTAFSFRLNLYFFLRQNKRKQKGVLIRKLGVTSSTKKLFVEITFLHSPVSYTYMVTYEYSHNNKRHKNIWYFNNENLFLLLVL